MTNLERYRKRYAAQYENQSFETILVGVRRRHVLRWLERYRAQRVLEVGCGLEPLFAHCENFSAWWVVEPINEFAEGARGLAAGDGRVGVLEGTVEEQSGALAAESFDFVVVSSLLHEVPDPMRLLKTVRGFCAPDTVVHLNVPNALSFHRLLAVEMGLIADVSEPSERDRAFGHPAHFDRAQLTRLLEDAGFGVLESGTFFVKPFTHDQMDAILRTGAFPESLVEGLDRMTRHVPQHGCELYANARKL